MRLVVLVPCLLAVIGLGAPIRAQTPPPWEFEDPQAAKRAQTAFESNLLGENDEVLQAYRRAKEEIDDGGEAELDEAVRRLRWCISKGLAAGEHRYKILGKVDYFPFLELSRAFFRQGRWDDSRQTFEELDRAALAKSDADVRETFDRLEDALKSAKAYLDLAALAQEVEGSRKTGEPLWMQTSGFPFEEILERAKQLEKQPASLNPQRSEKIAGSAQWLSAELMKIYEAELDARRQDLKELLQEKDWTRWVEAAGVDIDPATCTHEGAEPKLARDRLYECGKRVAEIFTAIGDEVCERYEKVGARYLELLGQGFDPAPDWCTANGMQNTLQLGSIRNLSDDVDRLAKSVKKEQAQREEKKREEERSAAKQRKAHDGFSEPELTEKEGEHAKIRAALELYASAPPLLEAADSALSACPIPSMASTRQCLLDGLDGQDEAGNAADTLRAKRDALDACRECSTSWRRQLERIEAWVRRSRGELKTFEEDLRRYTDSGPAPDSAPWSADWVRSSNAWVEQALREAERASQLIDGAAEPKGSEEASAPLSQLEQALESVSERAKNAPGERVLDLSRQTMRASRAVLTLQTVCADPSVWQLEASRFAAYFAVNEALGNAAVGLDLDAGIRTLRAALEQRSALNRPGRPAALVRLALAYLLELKAAAHGEPASSEVSRALADAAAEQLRKAARLDPEMEHLPAHLFPASLERRWDAVRKPRR